MFRLLCILLVPLLLACPSLQAEAPSCFKEIERDFFRTDYVYEALSLQGVGQSNWAIINAELRSRAKLIPEIVEGRAQQMIPNPLAFPFDPEGAEALLSRVFIDVLNDTLRVFNIDNRNKAEEMYRYIRDKQVDRFNRCFQSL